jgi:riboflavin synthase
MNNLKSRSAGAIAEASMDLVSLVEDKPFVIDVIWHEDLNENMDTARAIAEAVREQVAQMNLSRLVLVNQRNNRVVICKGA